MQIIEKIDELLENNKSNSNIYVDKVTGLLNIFAFQNIIYDIALNCIKDIVKSKNICSLIVCDLNYLKNINDEFGHLAGNKALKDVSKIILSCVDEDKDLKKYCLGKTNNKLVFRVGGDEFLIILKNKNEKEAELIKEKINGKTNKYKNKDFFLSLAMGIVSTENVVIKRNSFNPRYVKKMLFHMLETADKRMFEDKINIKLGLNKNKKDKIVKSYLSKIYDFLELNINNKSDYEKFLLEIKRIINK